MEFELYLIYARPAEGLRLSLEDVIKARIAHDISVIVQQTNEKEDNQGDDPEDGQEDDPNDDQGNGWEEPFREPRLSLSTVQGKIKVLQPKPLEEEWPHLTLELAEDTPTSIAFSCMALSSNNNFVAIGYEDGVVALWDVRAGTISNVHPTRKYRSPVSLVVFSRDGSHFVTIAMSEDETMAKACVRDVTSRTQLCIIKVEEDRIEAAAFSWNNAQIATGSSTGDVSVWDVATGELQHIIKAQVPGYPMSMVFHPSRASLASCIWIQNSVIILDTNTGGKVAELIGHGRTIWAVRFSRAGNRLITSSEDGTCRMWDAQTGDVLHVLRHTPPNEPTYIWNCAFSPDDRQVATCASDGIVALYDSATGALQHVLQEDPRKPSTVFSIAYSPAGTLLASGSANGRVQLWDVVTGTLIAAYSGHDCAVKEVGFSGDAESIISWGDRIDEGKVLMWNVSEVIKLCDANPE